MPLLQSLEDDRVKKLKSLKYPSGQAPYVQKDINNPPIHNSLSTPITKRVDDVVRLGKMLLDTPGIKFTANQALLSQVDTLGAILRGERKGIDKEALRGTANVLKSIFKQVPVNGTGTHFYQTPAGGRYIYTDIVEEAKYAGVDAATLARYAGIVPVPKDQMSNFVEQKERRSQRQGQAELYTLSKESQLTPTTTNAPRPSSKTRAESLGHLEQPSANAGFIDGDTKDVVSYDEGNYKKSNPLIDVRGGNDTLRDPQTRAQKNTELLDPNMGGVLKDQTNESHFNAQGLIDAGSTPTGQRKAITIQRRNKPDATKDKEVRALLRNQSATYETDGNGNFKLDKDGNKIIKPGTSDYINTLGVGQEIDPSLNGSDFANFRFHINGTVLVFRAHLISFDDQHSAQWNPYRYVGRADNFYVYQGYDRTVNVSFYAAAASKAELQPIYSKLNYLASACAPIYENGEFMQGTISRITVGDYVKRQPGIINSVSLNWQKDYPWDINYDKNSKQLPMVLNATVSMNLIHNFVPEVGSRYIAH